jgi:chemotaxis protein MotA
MWFFVVLGIKFEHLNAFIDIPSIQIVVIGTLAGAFASFPLKTLVSLPGVIVKAFTNDKADIVKTIKMLVEFAEKARKEGILALEGPANKVSDEFLKKGLQLAVDGTEPDLIRDILETDISCIEERHAAGAAVFSYMASLAPSMGMLGTLIGLIMMLGNLSDIASVGPNMAVALITTFYGSLMANCFCTPVANTLEKKSAEESMSKSLMVEGIMSIQAGDNPRIVEQKLAAYLSPVSRTKVIKVR